MAFDVFISYSHHDNHAHGNWVEAFQERLVSDFRSRTGKKLQIFFDRDGLQAGNVLSDKLKGALSKTSLFIPILSPSYLSSEWCRREFLYFMEVTGGQLITRSGNCRIMPVRLMPFEKYRAENASVLEHVGRIVDFLIQYDVLYADFYKNRLPVSQHEPLFLEKIATLSEDIFTALGRLAEGGETDEKKQPDASELCIFLGYSVGGAKKLREQLLKELQQQRKHGRIKALILPDEAGDAPEDLKGLSASELRAFIEKNLRRAECSVHFFDDVEGPKTTDTREPVTHLQYRIATEIAAQRSDFHLFFANAPTEDCPLSQESFLKGTEQDAQTTPNIQVLPAFEIKAVKDFLLDFLQARKKVEEPPVMLADKGDIARRVFFVHDHRDKDDALRNKIDDIIFEQRFDVYVPVFREDDPYIDPDLSFRNFWKVSDKALILLRNATSAWCNAMKVELIKTATEKKPPHEMAICVADPDTERRIREVRSHEFRIINCAGEGFEQQIIQFLKGSGHA